jgi:hypothetical protein
VNKWESLSEVEVEMIFLYFLFNFFNFFGVAAGECELEMCKISKIVELAAVYDINRFSIWNLYIEGNEEKCAKILISKPKREREKAFYCMDI